MSDWKASDNHKMQELRRYRTNIASYNSSLTRKLDDIRSELEFRGADDVRLFTYVTAVFLPVGFATGVFSISEPPSRLTIGCMIGTGAVALLLTLTALVNAKFLAGMVVNPAIGVCGWAFTAPLRLAASARHSRKSSSTTISPKEEDSSGDTWRMGVAEYFHGRKDSPNISPV